MPVLYLLDYNIECKEYQNLIGYCIFYFAREKDIVVNNQKIPAGTTVFPMMTEILKGRKTISH